MHQLQTVAHATLSVKMYYAMLRLQSLQLQLQNLKVLFSDALGDQHVSIEQLRKIREQIKEIERRIEERRGFLERRDSTN
jgi:hypothetical protein